METLDVQSSQTFLSDDENQCHSQNSTWGRLLPIRKNFKHYDLKKSDLKFGREDECDYMFCDVEKDSNKLLAYSKVHFILQREKLTTGVHIFLKDTSSNGTFINGVKVGKNMKQVLNNNDIISLVTEKNKVFVFIDLECSTPSEYPDEINSNYSISKEIGRGAYGEVLLVFDKHSEYTPYAMKVIPKKKFTCNGTLVKDSSSEVQNEVNIMKTLKHPCIVQTHNVFDTDKNLYIILEFVKGGELFDRVVSKKRLKESTAKIIFYQILLAVKYLHSQGITHRDLKAENILLMNEDEETLIKVTDFGLSKLVNSATVMKTLCGTPSYLAPEILLTAGGGTYTNAIDCWSLGVILFVCLGGYPPFSEDYTDRMSLPQQIIKGCYSFAPNRWKDVSEEAINLIKDLLKILPDERLTVDQALAHKWLNDDEMKSKVEFLMKENYSYKPNTDKIITKRTLNSEDQLKNGKKARIDE